MEIDTYNNDDDLEYADTSPIKLKACTPPTSTNLAVSTEGPTDAPTGGTSKLLTATQMCKEEVAV